MVVLFHFIKSQQLFAQESMLHGMTGKIRVAMILHKLFFPGEMLQGVIFKFVKYIVYILIVGQYIGGLDKDSFLPI
jgi:hypothetical protein